MLAGVFEIAPDRGFPTHLKCLPRRPLQLLLVFQCIGSGGDKLLYRAAPLVRMSKQLVDGDIVPVGNSISLATDIESGDAPALCERSVA
jgi:hypothetical protein